MLRSTTTGLLVVSAFVLSLAGTIPEAAAHGGDATLVHACVNKSSGEVKIVAPNATCKPHENAVDWPSTAPAGGVTKVLTEISLVSVLPGLANFSGEKSRFLWEPTRYAPAPSAIFFEVVGALAVGNGAASVRFRLHDVTNNAAIVGSNLTITGPGTGTATGQRLRSGNLALPVAAAEIALIVDVVGVDDAMAPASFSVQRSAVLIQQ